MSGNLFSNCRENALRRSLNGCSTAVALLVGDCFIPSLLLWNKQIPLQHQILEMHLMFRAVTAQTNISVSFLFVFSFSIHSFMKSLNQDVAIWSKTGENVVLNWCGFRQQLLPGVDWATAEDVVSSLNIQAASQKPREKDYKKHV